MGNVVAPTELKRPDLRLTVDTENDLELIRIIYSHLYPRKADFSLGDVIGFLDGNPELIGINAHIQQKRVR